MSRRNWIGILLPGVVLMAGTLMGAEFVSPSKRQIARVTLDQIKYNLRAKGIGLDYRELFDKAVSSEKIGFMGYHGDSLDFLIYQDIIRIMVEELAEMPVRKDFHFVSIPSNSCTPFQSLEDLAQLFVKDGYQSSLINPTTFGLNFAIYANHNCLGLNSALNFTKNCSAMAIRNRNALKQLFKQIGMHPQLVDSLYDLGHQRLDSKAGVLLQFFDNSSSPYAFSNAVSYASYPNGFIAQNRLISEYFLDDIIHEFPQELRIILNLKGILNPASPMIIKRYTKIQPSKLKAWEQDLRVLIQAASFDPVKRDEWRQVLYEAWDY